MKCISDPPIKFPDTCRFYLCVEVYVSSLLLKKEKMGVLMWKLAIN